jgi:pimeloyl-ACP methyl ester carboxylesterase
MRGHGDSGWVGAGGYYHFYDYFDDVRRVVDALGCERLLLVGHSMGGSVATGTAALLGARVRALVLLEGMGPAFAELTRTRGRLGRWVAALGQPAVDGDVAYRRRRRRVMSNIEEAAERLRRFNPRLSEARSRALAGSFTEPVEHGVAWRFDPLHRTPAAKPFVLEEARALWAAVEAPTLSLFGELGFGPPDLADRHAALREVRAGVLPGVGHNIHHERPDVVARVLLEAHQTGQVRLPEEATEA